MNLIEKTNLMQFYLRQLEEIKENRRHKKIDDVKAYNLIKEIMEQEKDELIELTLYDVFEYAKEFYILRIA